jgi:hypothetical protein
MNISVKEYIAIKMYLYFNKLCGTTLRMVHRSGLFHLCSTLKFQISNHDILLCRLVIVHSKYIEVVDILDGSTF